MASGHQWGDSAAPVTVVTFMDFECPACRDFALGTERIVRTKYPDELRIVIRHLPLAYHRFAFHAAKAAECAAEQGRFHEMYDVLFAKQDSLGLKSMESFARESTVSNITAFEQCMSSNRVEARIHSDIEAAESAGARGTPTIILNGLRLAQPPQPGELERLVDEVLEHNAVSSNPVSRSSVKRQ